MAKLKQIVLLALPLLILAILAFGVEAKSEYEIAPDGLENPDNGCDGGSGDDPEIPLNEPEQPIVEKTVTPGPTVGSGSFHGEYSGGTQDYLF